MFGLMGLRGSSGPGPDTVARGGGGGRADGSGSRSGLEDGGADIREHE